MLDKIISQHYKLYEIKLKDKFIQHGGGNTYINLFISTIIIIIGIILISTNHFYNKTNAVIKNINNKDNETNLTLLYNINNINFTKNITTNKHNNYKINDIIEINYDINNPNIIKINKFNYLIIGIILIIIGMFIITNIK
jgi:hypothetical protein